MHAHIVLVAMVKSCDTGMAPHATALIVCARAELTYCGKLLISEEILEPSKFIVGSSYSGPGNKNSH